MGRFSRMGNDLFDGHKSIDFVGRKWLWYAVSGLIVLLAVFGLTSKGLNLGVEFEGGVEYTVSVPKGEATQATADKVKDAITGVGLKAAKAPIVNTSGDKAIRAQTGVLSDDDTNKIADAIETAIPGSSVSPNAVGPSWGQQVAQRAVTGLLVFLVLVVLFIWAYFREWKMSVAALVALAHDIIITVGVYALSGFEVTPATVTGLLAILGFSLYDTVVVFDKVRENTKDLRKSRKTYSELANLAINQSLVRSINTSIVALLPVGALLYVGVFSLGGGSLRDLALSQFVGMAAGAYSSIFIATPLLAQLKSMEKGVSDSDARARARKRRDADRYANVPAAVDENTLAPTGAPLPDDDEVPGEERPAFVAPPRRPTASGSGRTVPESSRPVRASGSAKRSQPSRQPRSKRKP